MSPAGNWQNLVFLLLTRPIVGNSYGSESTSHAAPDIRSINPAATQ